MALSIYSLAGIAGLWHAGRAFCQERVLAQHSDYAAHRKPVRRRLHNGVWQRVHRAEQKAAHCITPEVTDEPCWKHG
jgi:hypothetical protein